MQTTSIHVSHRNIVPCMNDFQRLRGRISNGDGKHVNWIKQKKKSNLYSPKKSIQEKLNTVSNNTNPLFHRQGLSLVLD